MQRKPLVCDELQAPYRWVYPSDLNSLFLELWGQVPVELSQNLRSEIIVIVARKLRLGALGQLKLRRDVKNIVLGTPQLVELRWSIETTKGELSIRLFVLESESSLELRPLGWFTKLRSEPAVVSRQRQNEAISAAIQRLERKTDDIFDRS